MRTLSSSSMALSSIESELVERLARRRNETGVVGDVPDKPKVVTESLRRWLSRADAVRGVGKAETGACETELLLKRLLSDAEVTDPRLCCRDISFWWL